MNNRAQPNILFLLTDQQLQRCLGFNGDDRARTPRLDALASDAAVFNRAYTTCPACTPARASIQTGLYPFAHGMQTNLFMKGCMLHELVDHPDLLSRRLESAGYTLMLTGKWHLGYGPETRRDPYYVKNYRDIDDHLHDVQLPDAYFQASGLPSDVGYIADDFPGHGGGGHDYPQFLKYLENNELEMRLEPIGESNTAEVVSDPRSTIDHFLADRAIQLINENSRKNKPFFCMLNFWGPHEPAYVPTEFFEPYRDMSFDPWPSWEVDLSTKPRIHHVTRQHRATWSHFETQLRFAYAYTSFIDDQIGRVLDHLQSAGQLDNTLIVFSADHGDSMGIQAGLSNKSFHMYEQTNNIPMVIRPPGGLGQRQDLSPLVNLTDLYETLNDYAGASPPSTPRHGRSLRPHIEGSPPDHWQDHTVTEGSGLAHCLVSQRMYRRGEWKYVFNTGDMDELYNLADDPHELHNLAAPRYNAPDELNDMRGWLADWMATHHDQFSGQYRKILRMG